MQLKNLFLAASAAATVSALPTAQAENAGEKTFGIVSIHSGSSVQYASFNAAKSSLFAGLSSQNASCARPQEQTATFYIKDGALYLYDQSATPQEFYVDRSGMGKLYHIFQYSFYYTQNKWMLMVYRPRKDRLHHRRPTRPQELGAHWLGHQRQEPPPIRRQ